MKQEFVTLDIALSMKQIGFEEKCIGFYNPTLNQFVGMNDEKTVHFGEYGGCWYNWNTEKHLISAPLWQQALYWLREHHDCHVYIRPEAYNTGINFNWQVLFYDSLCDTCWDGRSTGMYGDNGEFPTYEQAVEAAITEALKYL